ncbi:glycosyltransferase [Aliarcobacter cryaerophilus]|uniref:glycosyltransferase n=1 Tax=Aliarcobacter cryaerophilus TaxID=28198 RepID=UPI0021B39073|nr:glycosyltransferase [Aliarcobacter cryaerophilus]MCT7507777.1 glycosyltransferase [Aliarcobacter cryaerophilus]
MKIIIDLQGAQSIGNRNRGISRYSLSITKAILENKKEHEVVIVLSSLFLEEINLIRYELKDYIEEKNIRIWSAPSGVTFIEPSHNQHRKNAELIRETFIASLNPDIVLITSLFEGLVDDAVTSVGLMNYSIPTAVILYDLIPLINSKPYLDNPDVKRWYEEKIEHLKRADLLLSISESSKQEALEYLKFSDNNVVNISTASDSQFKKIELSENQKNEVLKKYHFNKEFLMYTGGIDHRKNIEGLIRSYALLTKSIRSEHQLAIVCSISDDQRLILNSLTKSVGLNENEVIFTGYIPEDDLVSLYNLCKAFIFPSWHEGFGLPALEAMNCGAPVIASNRSSLPEVIGLDDALFDSLDDNIMSKKIEQILTDETFREKLIEHANIQIEKFSWEQSAKKAIDALEIFIDKHEKRKIDKPINRLKLAYVSPLPPQKSGISDYSAELLPFLNEYYDIDVIVEQESISDDWINKNLSVHNTEWFKNNAATYDRILYHFGNSPFHQHMFGLINEYPGTVVLHDFYLGHVIDSMGILNNELYYSHGYKPLNDEESEFAWNYPTNKRVLDHSKGIIVHSENSRKLADIWYGDEFSKAWEVIPLLRIPSKKESKEEIRKKLNIPSNAFIVASFGLLGLTKQNQKLLDAWLSSSLSKDKNSYLIFIGENDNSEYGKIIENTIKKSNHEYQIKITGWADADLYIDYLNISDIGVQLRTKSRGETSASVLDCMNYGLATIVNSNGSMADLDDETIVKLPDEFTQEELVNALEELYFNEKKRDILGKKAKETILSNHAPDKCARKYFEFIENFYSNNINENDALIDSLIKNNINIDDSNLKQLADCISKNHQYSGEKQLFIDVSELVKVDSKSGIQRVVKSILKELLENPPAGYRIEPVYSTVEDYGYKYAKNFTYDFLSYPLQDNRENLIDFRQGDIFLGLDLSHVVISKAEYYKVLKAYGVKTYFIIYDILPILHPEWWPENGSNIHTVWLKTIAQVSDKLISISEAVSDDVEMWIEQNNIKTPKGIEYKYFHLGADIDNSTPSKGLPKNSQEVLGKFESTKTFLMVGTLEPRKGHKQTLLAFEELWQKNNNINLVIVGKQGWLMDDFASKVRNHPERNKRLFWLEGISDEYLEKVYETSTCLIAASEGEGFGLPLIEAAQHKKPIIARDIPVFKEVAKEFAYYFENTNEANVLCKAIKEWLELYKDDKHPKSQNMPWLTWQESTKILLDKIII